MKNNKGFSLVELIVVIAIMAILAAVAVIGVSVYIPKAQQASDKQMVADIEYVLNLHAQSTPEEVTAGYIILTPNGEAKASGKFVIKVLEATYGEDWESELKLAYDGWNATFQGSNFYDEEQGLGELLGTVDNLTGALGAALSNPAIADAITGGAFEDYVGGLGVDIDTNDKKADAAVFYIADTTSKISSDVLQQAGTDMKNIVLSPSSEDGDRTKEVFSALNRQLNSTLASTATMYAIAQGYANYIEAQGYEFAEGESPSEILNATTDGFTNENGETTIQEGMDAFNKLMEAFAVMGDNTKDLSGSPLETYLNTYLQQDLAAYSEAMKMVSSSKDNILAENGELGDGDYFSKGYIQGLVNSYAKGGVFVYVTVEENGIKVTSSLDAE